MAAISDREVTDEEIIIIIHDSMERIEVPQEKLHFPLMCGSGVPICRKGYNSKTREVTNITNPTCLPLSIEINLC